MSKKKSPAANPALPSTEIIIHGKTYRMCLDFGAIAQAEAELVAKGHDEVNLLHQLPRLNLSNTRIIFAASLRPLQPELSFEEALGLVDFRNVWLIASLISEMWKQVFPDADPEASPDPTPPAQ